MLILLIINFSLPGALNQGDRVFYFSARSLGIGGISDVLENGDNPAGSGLIRENFFFASAALASSNEKRGLRVYDSYGNNMGISTLSNNTSTNYNFAACALVIPLKSLRLGFKYRPIWDFNYFYRKEYRDDFYQITKIVEHKHTGDVHSVAPTIGFNYRFLNIGIEEKFLFGRNNREDKVIIPGTSDSISQSEMELSGTTMKLGAIMSPNLHFCLSYSYSLSYTLENEDGEDLKYPVAHSFGFMYQPAGRVPTKFLGEVAYENWTEPIIIYKFGMEHYILNNFTMRYGFCYFPDYEQRQIWTTVLTFGLGLKTGQSFFDLGFAYGKRDYSNSDFGGLDEELENLRFDESTSHFVLSGGFTF